MHDISSGKEQHEVNGKLVATKERRKRAFSPKGQNTLLAYDSQNDMYEYENMQLYL